MDSFSALFKKALSKSKKAFDRLDKGKTITVKLKSDRITYKNKEDTQYDTKWKNPDKKHLSPEGYDLPSNDKKLRDEIGINDNNKEFYDKKQISIPSTCLKSIKYNPDTEGLYVKFEGSNKTYFYPGVPLELVQALLKAPSKGQFFLKYIHDQYTMNKGHKPAGESKTYGEMGKKAVKKFFKKYTKDYEKNNKGKWSK